MHTNASSMVLSTLGCQALHLRVGPYFGKTRPAPTTILRPTFWLQSIALRVDIASGFYRLESAGE
jgi:hypothetical protein